MSLRAMVALLGALALVPAPAAGTSTPSFLCGGAKVLRAERSTPPPLEVALTDRLDTPREATLGTIRSVCWAEAPSTELMAAVTARTRSRKARRVGARADVVTRFGTQHLVLKTFAGIALGTAGAPPRTCYGVRGHRPGDGRVRVVVNDAAGERVFEVGRPARLCLPTGDDQAPELLCHAARLARLKPLAQPRPRPFETTLTTALGTVDLRVGAPRELCVPVLAEVTAGPLPTLRVTPSAVSVVVGARPTLEVTAHFADGHEEPYSHRARFASSDDTVVRGTSVAGAFVEAAGLGTAVVSAVDVVTGATSTGSGNAAITVTWPLEKLVLTPHATTKEPGAYLGYTVRGFFAGGADANLTQRVVYASSDEAVATAPNTPGNRSRVFAVAPGTVTISATDPISGISTTDSGNDATLRVAARLIGLGVESGLAHSSRFPGQVRRFTATGYYEDGSTKNLTQQCTWWSSEPAVAVTPNVPGDRSRVEAVAPGSTTIGCTEWTSGVTSWATPFWVLGDLLELSVYGSVSPSDWIRSGKALRLSARGRYAGGGFHNLTQDVQWTSFDPDVAVTPNTPGDRSRVDAVGPGDARIRATDLATGMFDETTVVSLGDLVSLAVRAGYGAQVLPVDGLRSVSVRGIFEHGSLNLSSAGRGFTLRSSDPSVLEVASDVTVRGVAPGVAMLTATDDQTGITSPPTAITVKGHLEALTLTPATATRGIGEWESFTAIGFYPPAFHENLTARAQYASSDPSVAVAEGYGGRLRTVGAGTTVVTATDPVSGFTATATLTVLPGTIERVTIEPVTVVRNPGNGFSFTAIGHYPGGATINVTQVVTWRSLAHDVGAAFNPAGDRSRVVAKIPGTAAIVALHPSGVSSHDTGDDATFTVKPVAALALTPAAHVGPVGMVERYTLVGTFDDATTINLTQDAYYWTDDPAVAVAEGEPGDRSAVRLLAPGATTVHASFADWTTAAPQLSGSVVGAFLSVVP